MEKESRHGKAGLGLPFLVALLACCMMHGQDVTTNYMPDTDFSGYRTYKWATIGKGGQPDQIPDAQIRQSIDDQLAAKGFTRVDSDKADFLVGYQVTLTREREGNGYGRGSGLRGLKRGIAPSSTITVGTLVLNIYDPGTKQLVWLGISTKTISLGKDPQKNQRNLDKATHELLKDFPPKRK